MTRQLGFDLEVVPRLQRAAFEASPANAAALAMIDLWPNWPDRALLLIGPPASGKSHLARIWMQAAGAVALEAAQLALATDLPRIAENTAVLVENAEGVGAGQANLFHLINLVRERRGWLMLTAVSPPDHWGLATADLTSRLRLAPSVTISAPDDALVRAVLLKHFNDRQLLVDPGVIDYVVVRMERSFRAARQLAAALDAEALARGSAVTRAVAGTVLAQIYGPDDLFEAE